MSSLLVIIKYLIVEPDRYLIFGFDARQIEIFIHQQIYANFLLQFL